MRINSGPVKAIIVFLCFVFSSNICWAQGIFDWKPAFEKIDMEVQRHSEAYTRLGDCTEQIGHRLTGSPNGVRAEKYAFDLLKSYGFEDVAFQSFTLNGWERESLDLRVGAPNDLHPVKAEAFATSVASANLEGELVDMGNGLERDYVANPEKARGKIVLASLNLLPNSDPNIKNIHRSAKATLAAEYGAKGIILFNNVEGKSLRTGTAGTALSIPALCISLEDGNKLKGRIAMGNQQAMISMKNKIGPVQARNVIARIVGNELPHEKIVVGGHLDSWDLAQGATDNGLGAFSVMDMARTFKVLNIQSKRTIEFVLFMGEEQGLLGSKAYVQNALKDGSIDRIRFMLNFDMANNPKNFYASREESKGLFEEISHAVSKIDSSFKDKFSKSAVGLYSDHAPFMFYGIPIGGTGDGTLSREVLNCYHADCDTFELVHEQELKNTIRFGSMLLFGLANAHYIPVQRLSDIEVRQFMIDNSFEEDLRLRDRSQWGWRWD